VCSKTTSICDFVQEQQLDILVLTETWLKGDCRDDVVIQELVPHGYKI